MASFNRVILVGNLTRDVELKYLPSGMAVTEVGLAVNDRRKTQSGEWVDDTTFVDVTLWGRQAEVDGEYLSKGSSVLIEGRLKYETWEKDGKKNSKLRVVGEKMQMLGGRGGGASGSAAGGATRPQQNAGNAGRADEADYGSPPDDYGPPASTSAPSQGAPVAAGKQQQEEDIPF